MTFSLTGFATVAREALELTGGGVTTVNADMRVGQVQETITVSGAAPVVDVQTSTSRETVLSNEIVQALPASRGYGNYLAAVPGIQGTGLVVERDAGEPLFASRGGRSSEGNMQIDGMNVGSSVGGGGVSGYYYDLNNAAEVQVTIAGGLAEVDRGGPAINVVPKTGGNTFAGTYFGSLAGEWAQGSNIDDELRSFGFTDPAALIRNWDQSFAFSGPVFRNRLWFFSNVRTVGTEQDVPNLYGNLNVSNPTNWTYLMDPNVKVRNAKSKKLGATRLTWQATHATRRASYIDYTKNCTGSSFSRMAASAVRRATAGRPRVRASGLASRRRRRNRGRSRRALEDHAGDLDGAGLEPSARRGWLLVVLDRVGRHYRPAGATDQISVTEQTTTAQTPFTSNFTYHGWPATSGTIQQNANYRASCRMSPVRTT